jgi:NAD(P)-dependent dehydrogenase (short-subunit alcohol dehydrogenase family)
VSRFFAESASGNVTVGSRSARATLPRNIIRDHLGVALLTGAASGIGRQLVLDLSRRGWRVAGVDCHPHALSELERELAREQHRFAWEVSDVTEAGPLGKTVANLVRRLGPIDLLIPCAGVAGWTPAERMDPAAIARMITVNLIGVSNTIAAVLPGMLARRRGHIVAVSSLASLHGLPGQMGYCASKAGLNELTRFLDSLGWQEVEAQRLRTGRFFVQVEVEPHEQGRSTLPNDRLEDVAEDRVPLWEATAGSGNADGVFDACYSFGNTNNDEGHLLGTSKEVGAELARILNDLTHEDIETIKYATDRFFIEVSIEARPAEAAQH